MPGTFSQIYIHVVFAVKGRQSLILPSWESQLYKYITGVVQNKDKKMLAINGMQDHIHFLFGMRPTCNISNLVQEVKKASNQFINEKNLHLTHSLGKMVLVYSLTDIPICNRS
jgi:REP element-mobilizing transposase RayT